ncbi:MAG: TlpA family protein disulfide reductase [Candidatus Dadabacteria bacterium]|nr:TlpA family protein disulfide reductase [Candidatus Dadabacteria bacterium]MYA48255.1 TlpA family protein disulfide reductase [Candidatus Dadabacteria bacterium]MYF47744.1 TlpA family protein disulfide reductase [Candidatus Dadabacteria bacterium]MYG82246.1 TlpA family protein disulfide reductase [Candidatus Dadabacteria bacterium]MYK49832.1 TlpA family protein disulfide reductase [Candidatus Dadabacteria bacterium]
MKISNAVSKILTVLIVALLAYTLWNGLSGKEKIETPSQLVGKPAPEFVLESFNGEKVRLSDFRGKTLLVNFWASWCHPCREEAPVLEKTYMSLSGKEVEFIGVNIMDDRKSAEEYIKSFGGTFVNIYDPENRIHLDYGVGGVPETFFVNPEGIITGKHRGPLTEKMIMRYIEDATTYNAQIREIKNL